MKGLDQIVVGAGQQAADTVGVAAAAAEHDYGQRRVVAPGRAVGGADLAQDIEAREVRKPQIEQQQIGLLVVAVTQRVGGAVGRERLVAVGGQVIAKQLERRLVVLADDHRGELVDFGQHEDDNPDRSSGAPVRGMGD